MDQLQKGQPSKYQKENKDSMISLGPYQDNNLLRVASERPQSNHRDDKFLHERHDEILPHKHIRAEPTAISTFTSSIPESQGGYSPLDTQQIVNNVASQMYNQDVSKRSLSPVKKRQSIALNQSHVHFSGVDGFTTSFNS